MADPFSILGTVVGVTGAVATLTMNISNFIVVYNQTQQTEQDLHQ